MYFINSYHTDRIMPDYHYKFSTTKQWIGTIRFYLNKYEVITLQRPRYKFDSFNEADLCLITELNKQGYSLIPQHLEILI